MYSLILMTAMSGAPEVTEFNGFFRRLFSFGGGGSCSGSGAGSEYGSCSGQSTGCTGSSSSAASGCYGSGRIRAFGGGSCYGSGTSRSNGCYASGSGRSNSCQGSSGSSCMGSSASLGCSGAGATWPDAAPLPSDGFAAPAPAVSFAPPPTSFGYSLGSPAVVSDPFAAFPTYPAGAPITVSPAQFDAIRQAYPYPSGPPATVPEDRTTQRTAAFPAGVPTSGGGNRATVVVRLPADAKLYAEGRLLTLTSTERSFVTPPLPGAQEYGYTFRAEYVRNGETISQSRRVSVTPGGAVAVEFADLTVARAAPAGVDAPAVVAKPVIPFLPTGGHTPAAKPLLPVVPEPAKLASGPIAPAIPVAAGPRPAAAAENPERARITVKLPAGATLFVDGKKNERSELVREFRTPPLPSGQEFAYLMKAELVRDGRPESQMTKVTFRAGEIVTVDFTDWRRPDGQERASR